MQPAAKKAILRAWEQRLDQLTTHPEFGYRCSYRTILRIQARLLVRLLRGDIPHRALTNTRRSYLCTYDVASDKAGDKRRSKLFDLLMDHGEHVQFSVFLCVLTRAEITRLNAAAEDILHRDQDQLLVIDLGADGIDWTTGLTCVGKIWTPQVRSRII